MKKKENYWTNPLIDIHLSFSLINPHFIFKLEEKNQQNQRKPIILKERGIDLNRLIFYLSSCHCSMKSDEKEGV